MLDWLALALVTVGAAAPRLVGLSRPIGQVFDEIFYARNACRYVIGSEQVCGIDELASRAHPPLGNWLIGTGIRIFGFEPVGWRIAAAVAGILGVALTFVLARHLLRGLTPQSATIGAFAAGGLLATDFLHLVQSRTAMLDVFVTLFVIAAILFVVLDRDRPRDRGLLLDRLTLGRPWRMAAGAALGAATATKWSGAYVALAVIGLTIAWEIGRRRDARGWWSATLRAVRQEAPRSLVLLAIIPVLVYMASYIGRMPGELIGLPWREGTVWRGIFEHQRSMLDFHTALGGHHPYESPPWSWLLLKRPVAYFFTEEGSALREIVAIGNPLVWWTGILAVLVIGLEWARRGASHSAPAVVVLAAVLATYLPWLILSGSRSQVFIWYVLPTIPFLCVALGLLAAWAWRWVAGRVAVGVAAVAVLATFVFFVPLLTALPLSRDDWALRIWFRDCDRRGAPALHLPDDRIDSGPPPEGWCWI